jgi:mRNA interferase YafQ
MLTPVQSTQFKKDVEKARKRGKDLNKLKSLLSLLVHQTPLPEAYQDHPLRRELERCRGRTGCCCTEWMVRNCSWPEPAHTPICFRSSSALARRHRISIATTFRSL